MIRKISSLVAAIAIMLTFVGVFGIAKVDATEYTDTIDCPAGTVVSGSMTFATDCFTIVHAKGSSSSNVASYSPWRIYVGHKVTITANDALVTGITKVELVDSGDSKIGALTSTAGTVTMTKTSKGTSTIDSIPANTKELTISATSQSRWSSVKITYEKDSSSVVDVTSVVISEKDGKTSLKPLQTLQLSATVSPSNATYTDVTWSSSNNEVATVDQNGVVTGVSEGETIIYATAHNDVKGSYNVSVLGLSADEKFALLTLNKKLSFDYHWSSTETPISGKKISFTGATGGKTYSSSGLTFDESFQCDITELTDIDSSKFQVIYDKGKSNKNYYIKDDEIRLYSGTSLIINALGDNTITALVSSADGTNGVKCSVAEGGKSATISGATKSTAIKSITITADVVDVLYEYTVEKAAVYCRYGVSKELYDAIIAAASNATFGFQIGSNNYACEATYDETEEVYYFACIVEEIPAASFGFTMTFKGYVTINGSTTYTDVQSFSVKSLATTYLTDYATDSAVQAAKGVLTYLSTYGE